MGPPPGGRGHGAAHLTARRPGFYGPLGLTAFAAVTFLGFFLDLVFSVSVFKVTTYVRGLSAAALTSVLAPQIVGFTALTAGLIVALGLFNGARPRAAWTMLLGAILGVIVLLPVVAELAMTFGKVSPADYKAAVLVGTATQGGR
jgi:hypothetical protein